MLKGVLKKMSAATLLLIASQGVLLVAMQVVSQRLGKSGYGRFGLAMSVSVFAYQFIQWGMDQVLTVKFARGSIEDSRRLMGLLLRQKQLASALTLILVALVLIWQETDRSLIFLGALDGVCIAFTIPSIFDARGSTSTWQLFAFLRHAIYLAILLFCAEYYPSFFTPIAVVELHLACVLPEILMEQIWIRRQSAPVGPAPLHEAIALCYESAPMALAVLAQQMLFYCGLPIMQAFGRDSETAGLYLSNQFSIGAASFIAVPAAILHARLALHAHEGAGFARLVWRMTVPCLIAGIVVSAGFTVVGTGFVRHFFKSLADTTPAILAIDAWRMTPIFACIPVSSGLICLGNLRTFALCNILSTLIGIGTVIALVPAHGVFGVTIGIVVGRALFFVLCATFFYAKTHRLALESTP